MKNYFKYTFFLFFISQINLSAQNSLFYGFQKNIDNYLFLFNTDFNLKTNFGIIHLSQRYTGAANSNIKDYFRDDENFQLKYSYPINNNFSLLSQSNYNLNSDRRSVYNKYQRINSSIGMQYAIDIISINAFYGVENNEHQYFQSIGNLMFANLIMNELDFNEFAINANGYFEHLNLKDKRNNNDLILNLNLYKTYDENNQFSINSNFKNLKRDFASFFSIDSIIIETRDENKLQNQLFVSYSLTDYFVQKFAFFWEKSFIDRFFNRKYYSNTYSFTTRKLEIDNLMMNAENIISFKKITQKFIFTILYRNERNFLENRFNLLRTELFNLINYEKQKDNTNTQFRLASFTNFNFTDNDTLGIGFISSINRYDTPSKYNYDDRDELMLNANVSYIYKLEQNSRLRFVLDIAANHLVFLRSQRSALNNWNRILRFNPVFEHKTKHFSFKPQFEIIANYTIYDYEKLPNSSKSFSFRQVSYNDSINVMFNEKYHLTSRVILKYNERGILYWDTFSELPQQANFEFFSNSLFYFSDTDKAKYGLGVRFYNLHQYKLQNFAQISSSINILILNFGPELNISYQFINRLNVNIIGWYEFRYYNRKKMSSIANLILQTNLSL